MDLPPIFYDDAFYWNSIFEIDDSFYYLDIGKNVKMKKFPRNAEFMFWEMLYEKYAHPPFDIY